MGQAMSKIGVFGVGGGLVLATSALAIAADLPVKAPVAYVTKAPPASDLNGFDWDGWYVGAHVGAVRGASNWSATQPGFGGPALNGSFDLPLQLDFLAGTGSYAAGVQAGYNYVLPSHWLLGFEVDASFPNSDVNVPFSVRGSQTVTSPLAGEVTFGEAVIAYGSARGRLGYEFGHVLVYGTGGLAWTYDQVTRTQVAGFPVGATAMPGDVDTAMKWRLGWAAGAGLEFPIAGKWSAKAEFLWTDFGHRSEIFPNGAQAFASDLATQSIRLGLNYRIGESANLPGFLASGPPALEASNFAFHAQATYFNQYDPPFRAPVSGPNSLAPNIGRETADLTFYAGTRLWQGAEAWINPEVDQGFGLSGTHGLAGFSSGEAYKVGADFPYARLHRVFLRQTIDLGGEVQKVDAGINQFSGTQTSDRLVLTVGKFSAVDIFDTNKYAHDPRSDFLNWTVIDTATFDYAADAWGYTVGAAAEWYQGAWTLRAGLFDLSIAPNATALDPHFGQFEWVGEIERRYTIWEQPGKIAVTGYLLRGRLGSFADAIALAAVTGGPANTVPVRLYRSREGISLNLEQQLVPNVGFFARAGIANGDIEPYEFTDIDRTVAAGLSVSGKQWGRENDTFGIAGVVNGSSSAHQAFLNAGGLGILVGDGQLPHPGNEGILETYYSFPVFASKITLDYQLIVNPAYNRDRGPVSVLGFRVHTQY
jgi:high affinity Mn2+ porin